MEQYFPIIIRTLILYILILGIFRLMGKREIGELSILDLVVYIMIAEMAAVAIENTNEPLLHSILPIFLLVAIQIILALLSLKSKKFRDIVDGKPTIIINQGKIDEHAMRAQRYNFDDLLLQLREKDIKNVADVEFAVLEPSGTLSVFQKNENKKGSGIPLPLVIDGVIQKEHLEKIHKTESWLLEKLQAQGHSEVKNISFCSYTNGNFYIDIKDEI
ncbi:DUF421 domain-containing protein [Bacillus sp. T33-2]|uniref:DUF421 domain-containing protein n=1 Tax=Bacillus sp. T33-2 TaxID=2054168 RepID=UPI000C76C195|nr:DUF421 domain-containing protein [Bacillus sp. T33-2]PLR93744.1 hypothetical protein CVD19_18620 [Bacillus sp. T33-2]